MLFCVGIAIFVILVGVILCLYNSEGFLVGNSIGLSYCQNCGYLGAYKCGTCTNCGYCVSSSGVGECVPGDVTGPYFRQDCVGWNYGIPYVRPVTYVSTTPWYDNYSPWAWNVPKHVRRVRNDIKDKQRRHKKK